MRPGKRVTKTFSGDGAAKAAEFSYKAGAVLLRWMELVDKALALIDVTTLASQAAMCESANEWQVAVRAPKVILTPAKMTLACGEKRGLIAQVKNGGQTLSGDLVYEFTNTAKAGHLTSDANAAYKDNFSATTPSVYYTANTAWPAATSSAFGQSGPPAPYSRSRSAAAARPRCKAPTSRFCGMTSRSTRASTVSYAWARAVRLPASAYSFRAGPSACLPPTQVTSSSPSTTASGESTSRLLGSGSRARLRDYPS
jgi:hypothetical protein